jgi:hypothetical protein
MRYALAVLALLAGAAVWLLMRESHEARAVRRDEVSQEEARGARGRVEAAEESAATGGAKRRADAPDGQGPAAPKCRLVYADGAPAAGIELKLALGRPLHTRIYRNGDYPEKVIWLVTRVSTVHTGPDGTFAAAAGPGPRGARLVAYTDPDSPAFVLAEIDPHQGDVPALRRVHVTGTLRAPDGGSYDHWPVAAQNTRPEDWQTRYSKEKDSFVHAARGDLGVDPGARVDALTDAQARFDLSVVPGRNWILFGEHGRLGTRELVVPPEGLDLGEIVVRPLAPAEEGGRSLHGFVLDCAGQPRPGAEVRFWDGTVGEASQYIETDDKGRFACGGLKSPHVIAWAMSDVTERHVVLPEQCSGTIRMPCNTPVTLTAPAREEYQWLASRPGFHLFIRDGVFLGAGFLGGVDRIGLPPGTYHVIALVPGRILEADHVVTKGGLAQLLGGFRDTTHR